MVALKMDCVQRALPLITCPSVMFVEVRPGPGEDIAEAQRELEELNCHVTSDGARLTVFPRRSQVSSNTGRYRLD